MAVTIVASALWAGHPWGTVCALVACILEAQRKASQSLGKGEHFTGPVVPRISHVTKVCPLSSLFLAGRFNFRQEFLGMTVPSPQGKWPELEGGGVLPWSLLTGVCAHLFCHLPEWPGPLIVPPVAASFSCPRPSLQL